MTGPRQQDLQVRLACGLSGAWGTSSVVRHDLLLEKNTCYRLQQLGCVTEYAADKPSPVQVTL
jgi:hypothetical protein